MPPGNRPPHKKEEDALTTLNQIYYLTTFIITEKHSLFLISEQTICCSHNDLFLSSLNLSIQLTLS